MLKRSATFAIAAAMAVAPTAPAVAQIQAGNLVNVNVGPVLLNRILSDNNISVQATAPITVQLPISAAANVCNVAVNVLAQEGRGDRTADCDATSSSDALTQQVIRVYSTQQQ